MKYTVYILQSFKLGRYYIGSSSDVVVRLTRHNSDGSPATRLGRPWQIVYQEVYETRAQANAREKQIKSYHGGEAFKKLILKHYTPSGEIA